MKKFTLMIMMLIGIMAFNNPFVRASEGEKQTVQVANLAELRTQVAGGETIYQVTGEVVLTHQHGQRNQKYFQDSTAAILVDDNTAVITTAYDLYDGVTGLTGTLSIYREMLQFIPTADPGAATSKDNVIAPTVLTLAEILPEHQAMLVRVNGVDFTGDVTTFAASANYPITDGTNNDVIFRTPSGSADLDYFGTPVPEGSNDLLVLVGQFDATMQVFSRSLSDFYPDGLPAYDVAFAVIDEQGTAINDAVVTFDGVTLAEGVYVIADVNAGNYDYSIARAGFYTRSGQLAVTKDTTTTVVLVAENPNAVTTFPWNEGFEGETFPPANWNHYALGAGGWATTDVVNAGVKAAWHNFNTTAADSWLVTPQIQLSADDNVLLKFFQKNGFMDTYGYSGVMISAGSGNPEHGDFVEVYESSAAITTYTERIIGLGDYVGQTIYIAFVYQGENAHQWLIDDVVIEDAPEAIGLSNLAELRDGEIGGDLIYQINGEVVITHMHGQRNQIYVQDATAGVVIDDPANIIETTFNQYDGLTGIKGKLSSYNGLLQLTPTEDPLAASSSNNVVTPLRVTMSEITAAHQSMLLAIADVEFITDLTTLEASTNYSVTDGTDTLIMRPPSNSAALDYFGTSIPAEPVNMIVIGSIYGQDLQFFPRSLADIDVELNVEGSLITNPVNVFPNPFNGYVRLEGLENVKQVVVLNGLGQTVEMINNPSQILTLNTESYKQGIYFVRIVHQNGNQSVNKMIKR